MRNRSIKIPFLAVTAVAAFTVPVAGGQAQVVELGTTSDGIKPSCPAKPCLAVSRTTGVQLRAGGGKNLFTVPRSGRLVAWSLILGKPGKKQTSFFNSKLGGEASARITVMRPGKRSKRTYRVLAESPIVKLEPYFGTSVQFPLARTLSVRKGYVIALTIPSWAPALAVGLDNRNSWRASRDKKACNDTQIQTVKKVNDVAKFDCLYKTARLTYGATIITGPAPK